jgi:outer membrane protein OmpA-like peptidoglycan-associated protein
MGPAAQLRPRPPAAPPQAPWKIALGKLALDGYTVKITDFATRRPARYALTKLDVSLEKMSTARGSRGTLATRFGVDGKGGASAKGPLGLDPMFADLKVEVKAIPLVPIQPYIVQDFNVSLARGTVSADGSLKFGQGSNGKASFTYTGNANVAGFTAVEQATNLDFLRWEAFSAQGMKAGFNPVFLEISRLGLTGFSCDLTIEADGTTSLQRVVGAPVAETKESSEAAEPAEAAEAAASGGNPPAAPAPAPAAPTSSAAASEKVPIRIDTLTLQSGRIGLTDHFIQPNYSATLTDLAGQMAGLSTVEGTVASLNLRGTLANHSPIEIAGSVNPLAAAAFADVKATFRDIDLPPFTPYSGKYAGYAIARGSLTMEVAYKLQNRKLAAQNHFLVDQFEFGEKIESKSATKLPVGLAVSLLRDKDGLIDLDLPIEGSLDDPKFKVWGVLWKVVGNLVGKAITAPFTLLGKLLGGGSGQEFSSVDFADGRDTLDDAGKKKLDALAKALANRPALKLEATGRVSGDKDREALKLLRLERKVKAQKLAGLSKTGEAPASVDEVVVDEKEYDDWLAKAFKKESFSKPRNALGFAKSLPASEMRELMLANLSATDDDLRQLALSRASAVKDYLTTSGKVEAARIFVLEPGAKPPEPAGKPSGSRVDFALR